MKAQLETKVISSLNLYLDHQLLQKGQAFQNTSSLFYPVRDLINGAYTYAAPFKQIVSDTSISGATALTGVYVNGIFTVPGQNNLIGINHDNGHVYFSSKPTGLVSGNYAVKEFNLYPNSKTEEELIFETKFDIKPKVAQTQTGLMPHNISYPAVFVRWAKGENEPFAFGGVDRSIMNVRCLVLSDNPYALDNCLCLLKNLKLTEFNIVEPENLPWDNWGNYTGRAYNYDNLQFMTGERAIIWDASFSKMALLGSEINNQNPGINMALLDYEVNIFVNPRD